MNLETSEISHLQKDKYCMTPLMWKIHEFIKFCQIHRDREVADKMKREGIREWLFMDIEFVLQNEKVLEVSCTHCEYTSYL